MSQDCSDWQLGRFIISFVRDGKENMYLQHPIFTNTIKNIPETTH
jgi:hypothetical protein